MFSAVEQVRSLSSKRFLLTILMLAFVPCCFSETRSAQDMAKECRVALDLLQGHIEKSYVNTLFAGECIGYIQGAGDVSLAMSENVKWFKVCISDTVSTQTLI